MIMNKISCVLEDKNGLPIVSIVGTQEFCFKSVGNTITDENMKNLPKELQSLIRQGKIRVNGLYTQFTHDNKPEKNCCFYCPLNLSIDILDLARVDYVPDKPFMKLHKDFFGRLSKEYDCGLKMMQNYVEKLEEEDEKTYEQK